MEVADEGRESIRTAGHDADRSTGRVADSDGRAAGRGSGATECAEIHRQLTDDQPGQFHCL